MNHPNAADTLANNCNHLFLKDLCNNQVAFGEKCPFFAFLGFQKSLEHGSGMIAREFYYISVSIMVCV